MLYFMKDDLKIRFNIISAALAIGGVHIIYELYRYIKNTSAWGKDTYQIFLQTTIETIFLIFFIFLETSLYHQKVSSLIDDIDSEKKTLIKKNKEIEDLNIRLNERKIYDTEHHVPRKIVLERYLERMHERGVELYTILKIRCDNVENEKKFLSNINYVKGANTEVFLDDMPLHYLILLINTEGDEADRDSMYFLTKGCMIDNKMTFYTRKTSFAKAREFIFQ